MEKVRKAKQLETQIKKLWTDAETLKLDLGIKTREYQHKLDSIKKLKFELEKVNSVETKTLKVSEHAILRYIERVSGIRIEEIEQKILSESLIKLVEKLDYNNGTYPMNEDFSVIIKDLTVVTII